MENQKKIDLDLKKSEFLLEKEMIDWLVLNGVEFSIAVFTLKYANENKISIANAYADCFLEESDKK